MFRFFKNGLLFPLFMLSPLVVQADFEKGEKANREGDRHTAFQEYLKAGNNKDARAYGKLASMYLYGLGTDKDYIKAYAWFGIAELSGDKYSVQFQKAAASNMTRTEIGNAQALLEKLKSQLDMDKIADKK